MFAKFFKAAERRKKAQALAEENELLCLSSTDRPDGTQLKKSVPSESYNSCETGINKECSDYSKSSEIDMNLSKMMENSLHLSKSLGGNIKTNVMFLEEGKQAESNNVDETVSTNTNDLTKVLKNSLNISKSKLEGAEMTLVDYRRKKLAQMNKVPVGTMEKERDRKHMFPTESSNTNPDRPTEMMESGIHGTKQKMEAAKMVQMELREGNLAEGAKMTLMDYRKKKLAHMNKVPVDTIEKERDMKHMLPGRPSEVMESLIHGSKQKMEAAKMVEMELRKGNLAESSNMHTMDASDGQIIFQTGPTYVYSKNTSEDYLQGSETLDNCQKFNPLNRRKGKASKSDVPPVVRQNIHKESHMDVTKTHVSQIDRERMRIEFNKLAQKRNPDVRQITNILEDPSLFDKLFDSVYDMNYNGGKNPVAVLNELIPNLKYHIQKSGPQHLPNFKVSVTIDGHSYCGVGKTKKAAQMKTAEVALKGIGISKKTATNTRTSIPKNVKSTYIHSNQRRYPSTSISGNQSTSISSDQDRIPPGHEVNAVSALNNLKNGLKYQCVAQHGPSHLPNFKVTVKVDQKVYYGTGRSKKLAKDNAARKALMCINGEINNFQGASVGSKKKKNTSNGTTTSVSKQYVELSVPKGKPPFAVLNDLYHNPEISWTIRDSEGNVSFTITLNDRKFTGVGLNMKSAKNNAAIRALHELRGFSPANWENH